MKKLSGDKGEKKPAKARGRTGGDDNGEEDEQVNEGGHSIHVSMHCDEQSFFVGEEYEDFHGSAPRVNNGSMVGLDYRW